MHCININSHSFSDLRLTFQFILYFSTKCKISNIQKFMKHILHNFVLLKCKASDNICLKKSAFMSNAHPKNSLFCNLTFYTTRFH